MKEIVFLYLMIGGYNSSNDFYRWEMKDYSSCWSALEALKINNSPGAESENIAVAFCANQFMHQRQRSDDPKKEGQWKSYTRMLEE